MASWQHHWLEGWGTAPPGVITYRSVSSGYSAGNVVITKPSGCVDGDCLLAFVRPGFGGNVNPPTTGATWNLLRTDVFTANHSFKLYWKIAASEAATATWVNTVGSGASVIVLCLSGTHQTTPVHLVGLNSTAFDGDEIDAPSITTTTDGCFIIRSAHEWGDGSVSTNTWASGVTKRADQNMQSVATDDVLKSPAGTTGTCRIDWGVFPGSTQQSALTIAIAPGAVVPSAMIKLSDVWVAKPTNIKQGGAFVTKPVTHIVS